MISFGSPSRHSRAPPLLHFLIDLSHAELSEIEFAVTKVLLYYYYYVDNRFTWTFSLFDSSHGHSSLYQQTSLPNEFNKKSLLKFHNVLQQTEVQGKSMDSCPLSTLVNAIEIALQEMKWDWNSSCARMSGALLSPVQKSKKFNVSMNYSIRNMIYVLSSCPKSWPECQEYVGCQGSLEECIQIMSRSFLEPCLMSLLQEKRCCLNFVDFSHENGLTESLFESMKLTGGSLIPFWILSHEFDLPFYKIFEFFRPLKRLNLQRIDSNGNTLIEFLASTKKIKNLHCDFSLETWLAKDLYLQEPFLVLSDKEQSDAELKTKSLDVWDPCIHVQSHPETTDDCSRVFDDSEVIQKGSDISPEECMEKKLEFTSFEQGLDYFHSSTMDLMYHPTAHLSTLFQDILPPVYSAIDELSDESADPVQVMVEFMSQRMIQNVSELDRKGDFISSWTPDNYLDKVRSSTGILNAYESQVISIWYSKLVESHGFDRKMQKEKIQTVKIRGAQIQILLLLECLRLYVETQVDLLPLKTLEDVSIRKSKRAKKPAESSPQKMYEQCVLEYIDRLCIWDALSVRNGQSSSMYSDFVVAMIQNYYETALPNFIACISAKFEPAKAVPGSQGILESPVFKKRIRSVSVKKKAISDSIQNVKTGSDSKKGKRNSGIWEKLSKRTIPLRKGKKGARPSMETESTLPIQNRIAKESLDERILVFATPQKPRTVIYQDFVLKS